jgi:hypothetical protein
MPNAFDQVPSNWLQGSLLLGAVAGVLDLIAESALSGE